MKVKVGLKREAFPHKHVTEKIKFDFQKYANMDKGNLLESSKYPLVPTMHLWSGITGGWKVQNEV